jgi:hypothetical protein
MTGAMADDFAEKIDAAAGPLKRLSAVTAQIGRSRIPADASCHCLCSIYEPHLCDGWRADGCEREIPAEKVFGFTPAPVRVPLCRGCDGAQLR